MFLASGSATLHTRTQIAHLATRAVAPVDDVSGDAAVWLKIESLANRVSYRNPDNA